MREPPGRALAPFLNGRLADATQAWMLDEDDKSGTATGAPSHRSAEGADDYHATPPGAGIEAAHSGAGCGGALSSVISDAAVVALAYELLDAHDDTAQMAVDLAVEPTWAAHLEYLRALQRTGRSILSRFHGQMMSLPDLRPSGDK